MPKGFPDKKIPREIQRTLRENDFHFVRCRGHAIFKHGPSKQTFAVKLSHDGGNGFFTGNRYTIDLIKKLVTENGYPFKE